MVYYFYYLGPRRYLDAIKTDLFEDVFRRAYSVERFGWAWQFLACETLENRNPIE